VFVYEKLNVKIGLKLTDVLGASILAASVNCHLYLEGKGRSGMWADELDISVGDRAQLT
jgi:hypothetical protein